MLIQNPTPDQSLPSEYHESLNVARGIANAFVITALGYVLIGLALWGFSVFLASLG